MEQITRINLPRVESTNTFVRDMLDCGDTGEGFTLVTTDNQTAGRGQVGNHWESEPGKNLAFSLLCHPDFVRPSEQFCLSECIALAVQQTVAQMLEGTGRQATVKWPNDIYIDDCKVSGTLIECDLMGKSISNCIIGTGLNVNQTQFLSDAPNPISLIQAFDPRPSTLDREAILSSIIDRFCEYYTMVREGRKDELHDLYMTNLYRREGMHRYSDVRGEFMAEIAGIEPTGHLLLRFENGNIVRYEFKEVKTII